MGMAGRPAMLLMPALYPQIARLSGPGGHPESGDEEEDEGGAGGAAAGGGTAPSGSASGDDEVGGDSAGEGAAGGPGAWAPALWILPDSKVSPDCRTPLTPDSRAAFSEMNPDEKAALEEMLSTCGAVWGVCWS